MNSWSDEQEQYRLRKENDSYETAVLLACIALALAMVVVISTVSERWILPWLTR